MTRATQPSTYEVEPPRLAGEGFAVIRRSPIGQGAEITRYSWAPTARLVADLLNIFARGEVR